MLVFILLFSTRPVSGDVRVSKMVPSCCPFHHRKNVPALINSRWFRKKGGGGVAVFKPLETLRVEKNARENADCSIGHIKPPGSLRPGGISDAQR